MHSLKLKFYLCDYSLKVRSIIVYGIIFTFIFFLVQKIMEEDQKRFIERGSHKGKGLAVFTSGGDSQGNS